MKRLDKSRSWFFEKTGHTLKARPKTVAKCAYFLLGNVIPGNRSEGQGY